jgi:hypothetical protein
LCDDVAECQPPDSPFYTYTHFGIDQMLKYFYKSVERLLNEPENATSMQLESFKYIYEVRRKSVGQLLTHTYGS